MNENCHEPQLTQLIQKFLNYVPRIPKFKIIYTPKNHESDFDIQQFLQNYLNNVV